MLLVFGGATYIPAAPEPVDPADFDPTAFYEQPNYTYVGPDIAVVSGQWVATVGTDLVQVGNAPVADDGAPRVGVGSNSLRNAVTMGALVGTGDRHVLAVARISGVTAQFASSRDSSALWTTNNGSMGIAIRRTGSGPYQYFADHYNFQSFAVKRATVEITSLVAAEDLIVVQGKVSGGKIWIRLGDGAWVEGDAVAAAEAPTDTLRVGCNYVDNAAVIGKIYALAFYPEAKADEVADQLATWGATADTHVVRWARTVATTMPYTHTRDGARFLHLGSGRILHVDGWNSGDVFGSGIDFTNEVLKSDDDGETFTALLAHDEAPPATGVGARPPPSHCRPWAVRDDGKAVSIGTEIGVGGGNRWVYETADGETYTRISTTAPIYIDGFPVNRVCGYAGGNLYLFGGQTDGNVKTTRTNRVDKSTDGGVTWTQIGNAPFSGGLVWNAVKHSDGKLYVVCPGAYHQAGPTHHVDSGVYRLDPSTDTWETVLADGHGQFVGAIHVGLASANGRLFLFNGVAENGTELSRCMVSDDNGATWTAFDGVTYGGHAGGPQSHADAIGSCGSFVLRVSGNLSASSKSVHRFAYE